MTPLLLATKPARRMLWAGMALVLLGLAPAFAWADVIIGNLGAGAGPSTQSLNSTDQYAFSFTMGSQAYSLSDVQITLTFSPPDSTRFQLQSDATGQPSGAVLFTFTNPNFFSGTLNYTFTADSPFTLAADTKYWLVGSTTNSQSADWVITSPFTDPTGSGANFGIYADSTDGGGSWFASAFTTRFELHGIVAVPEPTTLAFLAIALTAGAFWWRRRRVALERLLNREVSC